MKILVGGEVSSNSMIGCSAELCIGAGLSDKGRALLNFRFKDSCLGTRKKIFARAKMLRNQRKWWNYRFWLKACREDHQRLSHWWTFLTRLRIFWMGPLSSIPLRGLQVRWLTISSQVIIEFLMKLWTGSTTRWRSQCFHLSRQCLSERNRKAKEIAWDSPRLAVKKRTGNKNIWTWWYTHACQKPEQFEIALFFQRSWGTNPVILEQFCAPLAVVATNLTTWWVSNGWWWTLN